MYLLDDMCEDLGDIVLADCAHNSGVGERTLTVLHNNRPARATRFADGIHEHSQSGEAERLVSEQVRASDLHGT